jgi:hypothetical protein
MVNERQAAVAALSIPTILNRHDVPTSLLQAELPDLPRTRSLQLEELHSPVIKTAIGYWLSKQESGAPMRRAQFDPAEVPHLLPYLMLLEVMRAPSDEVAANSRSVSGGARDEARARDDEIPPRPGEVVDFRYRVIGDVIQRYSRANHTGRSFTQIEGKGPGSDVWRIAMTVVDQRRPVLVRPPYIGPRHQMFFCEWSVMPMVDDQGDIARLLIASDFLPESVDDDHARRSHA